MRQGRSQNFQRGGSPVDPNNYMTVMAGINVYKYLINTEAHVQPLTAEQHY